MFNFYKRSSHWPNFIGGIALHERADGNQRCGVKE